VHAAGRERNCWTPKNYDGGAFNKRFLLAPRRFCKLDPAEFPDARNQLELADRLFPRKTTVGAPNQRQRFVELFPALAHALV
jgi:hypothetical protein